MRKCLTDLRRLAKCTYGALSVTFLCVNMACAMVGDRGAGRGSGEQNWTVVLSRVLVNDSLFILEAVLLAALLLLLARHSHSTNPYLLRQVRRTRFQSGGGEGGL